ncbi:hypothetical protein J7F03_23325 [Streptomyces sp. ISL-43]|uniref:hypothetical protein n=1 Tax=Streptomyces sp. ISL-43 TaxID=2819183 RepID=UPI001BEBA71B|nr:hypothetical protein [Streptomyces sp. ISL-43]MBT2449951.1 hypothetical protein [Streptomyces sp. ISL-43]
MRGIGWTKAGAVSGAVLGALLVTGCEKAAPAGAPDASASASAQAKSPTGSAAPAGAFGKEQAAADVTAATGAAGLDQPKESVTTAPSPVDPATATATDKRRAELLACTAPWQSMERMPDPGKAYEATVEALQQRGWKAGERLRHDMLTQTVLTKQGWTVLARRYDFSAGKGSGMGMPDMLSFMATEQACEGRFTDAEMEDLLKDEPQE